MYWGYNIQFLSGLIFNDPNTGLKNTLDSKCRELQANRIIAQGQNVLSDKDVVKLYESQHLNGDQPHGFILRIIMNLALAAT